MESLNKKIEQLQDLLKQFNATIKGPKMPKLAKPAAIAKMPNSGIKPANKKDPVKVAEQIQNPDIKPMAMDAAKQAREALKISKLGQWNISKAKF